MESLNLRMTIRFCSVIEFFSTNYLYNSIIEHNSIFFVFMTDEVEFQGALGALQKICEDSAEVLNVDNHLALLIPQLFNFLDSPISKMRLLTFASNF